MHVFHTRDNRERSPTCYLLDEPRPIANRKWSNPRLDVTRVDDPSSLSSDPVDWDSPTMGMSCLPWMC